VGPRLSAGGREGAGLREEVWVGSLLRLGLKKRKERGGGDGPKERKTAGWAKRRGKKIEREREREREFEGGFGTFMILKTTQHEKRMQTKNDARAHVVSNIILILFKYL
jgi:hypothetical protein